MPIKAKFQGLVGTHRSSNIGRHFERQQQDAQDQNSHVSGNSHPDEYVELRHADDSGKLRESMKLTRNGVKRTENRRRRHSSRNAGGSISQTQNALSEFSSTTASEEVTSKKVAQDVGEAQSGIWRWISKIRQSADDSTVIGRIKDVLVFAEQYINNFYRDRPYHDRDIADCFIEKINVSPHLTTAQDWQEELVEADFQLPLLKHLLITRLLTSISYEAKPSTSSLLPQEFQSYALLARAKAASTADNNDFHDIQAKYSALRVLIADIRSDIQSDAKYLAQREKVVESMMNNIENVLQYWALDGKEANRRSKLQVLIEKAIDLGIFLFSQPSVFEFNWHISAGGDGIAVWPRVLRVWDDDAQMRGLADVLIPMKFGMILDDGSNRAQQLPNLPMPQTLQMQKSVSPEGIIQLPPVIDQLHSRNSSHRNTPEPSPCIEKPKWL